MNQGNSTLHLYKPLPQARIAAHRKNLADELALRVIDTADLLDAAGRVETTVDADAHLWATVLRTKISTSQPKVQNKRGLHCKKMNDVVELKALHTAFINELERLKILHLLISRFPSLQDRCVNLVMVAGLLFENILLHFVGGQCDPRISPTFIELVQTLYMTDAHEIAAASVPIHPVSTSAQTQQFTVALTMMVYPNLAQYKPMRTLAQKNDRFRIICDPGWVQPPASICDISTLALHLEGSFGEAWKTVYTDRTSESKSNIIRDKGNDWQQHPGLLVKVSPMGPGAGEGVFAGRPFQAGEFVGIYHGRHTLSASTESLSHAYADIGDGPVNWKILGHRHRNGQPVISTIAKVNNVCGEEFSNVELVKEYITVTQVRILVLFMQTTREVKTGEEFRYEYMRAHRNNNPLGVLPGCLCGSVKCRRRSFPS